MAEYKLPKTCPRCGRAYVAEVTEERTGPEVSFRYESPCPHCEREATDPPSAANH